MIDNIGWLFPPVPGERGGVTILLRSEMTACAPSCQRVSGAILASSRNPTVKQVVPFSCSQNLVLDQCYMSLGD